MKHMKSADYIEVDISEDKEAKWTPYVSLKQFEDELAKAFLEEAIKSFKPFAKCKELEDVPISERPKVYVRLLICLKPDVILEILQSKDEKIRGWRIPYVEDCLV